MPSDYCELEFLCSQKFYSPLPQSSMKSYILKSLFYAYQALTGGRLKYGHLEMIRLTVGRKMDPSRMFAIWRVDDPWQPITKRVCHV